jgi:hypothetical protein
MGSPTARLGLILLLLLGGLAAAGCDEGPEWDSGLNGGDSDSDSDSDSDTDSDSDDDPEAYIRNLLVETAAAELGMCEGVDDRVYMQNQPGLWCYDFVHWVYQEVDQEIELGLPPPISLPQMYVSEMEEGWRPAPGDLVKYQIQHFAMVASLSEDEITVFTIEGNWNSCVMERSTTDTDVEYYGYLYDWFDAL